MASRESAVRRAIRQALQRPGVKAVPYPGGYAGEAGTPDFLGCYRGRMFCIEAKAEGGKTSPIQDRRLAEWAEAGAVTLVARGAQEVRDMLDAMDAEA